MKEKSSAFLEEAPFSFKFIFELQMSRNKMAAMSSLLGVENLPETIRKVEASCVVAVK